MSDLNLYPFKNPANEAVRVPKSWGEEVWYHNQDYCAKLLHFNSDGKCSLHYHVVKDEVLVISRGRGYIICGPIGQARRHGSEAELYHLVVEAGDTVHMPRDTAHRIIAGPDGMDVFEASTHHEDADSVRIEK